MDNNKHRFLLSAKKFSGVTLISNYEDFPMVEMKPKRGFIARVEQPTDSSFLVCLTRCHLCDGKLGRFTCGRAPDEREVVAKITHNFQRINNNNPLMMDFRSVTVTIPVVSDSGMRKIWCPRSFEISFPRDIGRSIDMNEVISRYSTMGERYLNKLPEWNEDYKSLVLKFQGNRVLTASSKNFLIYAESYFKREAAGKSSSARSNGDKPTDRSSSSGDANTRQDHHHSRYTGRGSTKDNSRRSFHHGFESTTTTTASIEREREEDFESTTHLSNFDISGADFESSGFDENNSSLSTPIGKASGKSKRKTGGGDTSKSDILFTELIVYYSVIFYYIIPLSRFILKCMGIQESFTLIFIKTQINVLYTIDAQYTLTLYPSVNCGDLSRK